MDKQRIWKDVVGYEGLYEVSNDGIVRKAETKKTLKVYAANNGYERVSLNRNAHNRIALVHRVVAEAFIPNEKSKPCVNHIDGNKKNNTVENLEWCTHSENELHSHRVLGKKTSAENVQKMIDRHTVSVQTPVAQYAMD